MCGHSLKRTSAFGGVHVHVHMSLRNLEVEEHPRTHSLRDGSAISAFRGLYELRRTERPSVHEEITSPHARFRGIRTLYEPLQVEPVLAVRRENQSAALIGAPHLSNSRGRVVHRRKIEQRAIVGGQHEGDLGVGEREPGRGLTDHAALRAHRLQELGPRGRIVEQVPDLDRRSAAARKIFDRVDLPTVSQHPRSDILLGFAGVQSQPRYRCHRRQRFATEAEGADASQVVRCGYLARRVAVQAEQRVFPPHADAVVADPDAALSAPFDRDLDPGRPSVERVLDELLHHGRRAFHDLTRGDLVRHDVREYLDAP